MKRTVAGVGILALALLVGIALLRFTHDTSKPPLPETQAQQPRPLGPRQARVAELVAQRTSASRDELVRLYVAWGEKPGLEQERRGLIRQVIDNEHPLMALELIVLAVAQDPIALENDDLLPHIARDMLGVWKEERMVARGRDMLRLSDNVKAKALLAESLAIRVITPESELPRVDSQQHELASDLIQTYLHTDNGELRHRVLRSVEMVAGKDVAALLANPENAENSPLAKRLEASR